MEHFRTVFHLPEGRVNLRKECVCIFDYGVDVRDDEAVCFCYGLSVYLPAADDEAAGRRFLDRLGMTGRDRLGMTGRDKLRRTGRDKLIRFRQ